MSTTQRRPTASVIRRLQETPNDFEFFQAVRLLERHFHDGKLSTLDTIGEKVRFGNSLNIGFAPSEVEEIQFSYKDQPAQENGWAHDASLPDPEHIVSAKLIPSFIGLTGNHGSLPRSYTENLIEREMLGRDKAARAFLDIFANRSVTLFFQAWEKYRLHLHYEKSRHNRFMPMLLALLGMEGKSQQKQVCAPDNPVLAESLAFYSGALRQTARPAHLIARILSQHFAVPIRVKQFVGRWYALPPEQLSTLGMANMTLGKDLVCGDRMWQCQTGIALEIGPLTKKQFDQFLPHQATSKALADMVFMLAGVTLDCSVSLILRKQDVRAAQLGGLGGEVRLGYNSWVMTRLTHQDRKDVAYELKPRNVMA